MPDQIPIIDTHQHLWDVTKFRLDWQKDPDAEPFLALIADDPDPEVRKNARWALQQIAARKANARS